MLFLKGIARIQKSYLLESQGLHLDQLEQQFDVFMLKLLATTKAGWSKVAPILFNGFHIGWHHLRLKSIAITSVLKKELALELEDGGASERAEDAQGTWAKQHALVKKNGGNLIHRSGMVVLDTVGKFTKGRKDS